MPGLWITIDGPGGTGKTTTTALLTDLLTTAGHAVHRTAQPSRSEFGRYVRHAIKTLDGYPLACVTTADRYQQVYGEIIPALAAGTTVICDRYVPSAALDVLRGVPAEVVWRLHAELPAPTLAVVLTAQASVITTRIAVRGSHSRWQAEPDNTHREIAAYSAAAEHLRAAGWPLLTIDTTAAQPHDVAMTVANHVHAQIPTQRSVSRTHDSAEP